MSDEIVAIPVPPNGKIEPIVYAKPVGDLRLLQLKPQDPATRKLFPDFVQRCQAFIEVFRSDTDPIWLGQVTYGNFHPGSNYIHCLVALNDKDEIRAHSFAYVEKGDHQELYVNILQVWKSYGPEDLLEEGFKLIEEWARELGVKSIINTSLSVAHSRLYQKYGFDVFRVLGKKELR